MESYFRSACAPALLVEKNNPHQPVTSRFLGAGGEERRGELSAEEKVKIFLDRNERDLQA
jgi:hypothetical protein